jgi:hypothetical protein
MAGWSLGRERLAWFQGIGFVLRAMAQRSPRFAQLGVGCLEAPRSEFTLRERSGIGGDAAVSELPGGAVAEKLLDEGGMHGVAGALGNDAAPDAAAGEGEVANEVKDLVADELVGKAQRAILDAPGVGRCAAGEDDGGVVGDAADEAHVAQHLLVFFEAEGACGSDEIGVGAGFEVAVEGVATDGSGEVDRIVDRIALTGVDTDELAAFVYLNGLEDAEVFALAPLAAQAGGEQSFDVGLGAAVQDGDLEVVDLDDDVIDAEADEGAEEMFGGLDENALAHERGGVGDLGDVTAGGGNLKVVEIRSAEDDAGAGWSGDEAEIDAYTGVKADAVEADGRQDGLFELCFDCQGEHFRRTNVRLHRSSG